MAATVKAWLHRSGASSPAVTFITRASATTPTLPRPPGRGGSRPVGRRATPARAGTDRVVSVPIELSTDLPAPLVPLAWLVGSWAGAGVVGYPTIEEESRFGQEVEFSHDGRPFLVYTLPDLAARRRRREGAAAGDRGRASGGPAARPRAAASSVEVLLAHPTGFVEIYLGTADGPAGRPGDRRRRPHLDAPRSTPPPSGSTAWSRATCCGRWTWPPSASPCSRTRRPA